MKVKSSIDSEIAAFDKNIFKEISAFRAKNKLDGLVKDESIDGWFE